VIVIQRNRCNIVGLPYTNVLIDLVKIMAFIHDCGYLYRNIEPEHFMLSQEGKMVAIDFKRARRYIDVKGHPIEVSDTIYTGSPFASNNQVRGLPESRKDDLESIGYLALLLHEMEIPWAGMGKEQVIKIRSALTLQELFRERPAWI
jgi:serine/threonine protein kinase